MVISVRKWRLQEVIYRFKRSYKILAQPHGELIGE